MSRPWLKADLHIHSSLSSDSTAEINALCASAVEKGMTHICITDHFDMNPKDGGYGFYDQGRYHHEIDEARKQWGERLVILKGLEFAEPHRYPEAFEAMTKQDFDFILGSIHWFSGLFVGDLTLTERFSVEALYEMHFNETLLALRFGGFDSLAHFDLPLRYFRQPFHFNALVQAVLDQAAAHSIAVEINTSALRQGGGSCMPAMDTLAAYVHAGGERITLGSDAHFPKDIAADFDKADVLLQRNPELTPGIFIKRQWCPLF